MQDMFSFFGLKDNPFKLEVILETFVGYKAERERLKRAIESREKIILISGPTGAGKTTLMLWMYNNLNYKYKEYFYRPFDNRDEFSTLLINKHSSFFERFFNKIKKEDIMKFLNKKEFVIFIDEATFMKEDIIEWIKVLADQTKATFVLAGLPEFEERLLRNHRTFYERILTKIYLKSLDLESSKELIRKRLELAGNPNLFTEDALEVLYKITGGFPRELLKLAYEALLVAYKENKKIIDEEIIEKIYEEKRPPQLVLKLTEKQKYIAESIVKYGPKSVNELLNIIKERYPDMSIHALSNILKRMVRAGYLVRTKVKGKFVYDVVPAIKNYLIKEHM